MTDPTEEVIRLAYVEQRDRADVLQSRLDAVREWVSDRPGEKFRHTGHKRKILSLIDSTEEQHE